MGRKAGLFAADYANFVRTFPRGQAGPRPEAATGGGEAIDVREVRRAIQHLMSMRASIKRTAAGVRDGRAELAALVARKWDACGASAEFVAETRNIALVAEMVLAACGARPESRGPHLYFASPDAISPLPRQDPAWQKYNVLRLGPDGELLIETRKPVEPDWPLVQQIDA